MIEESANQQAADNMPNSPADHPEVTPVPKTKATDEQSTPSNSIWYELSHASINAYSAAAIAAFTFVLMLTSIVQLCMLKSTHETSERAWITIRGVTLEKNIVGGQEAHVVAGLKNSGHSPALRVGVKNFVTVAPSLPLEQMQEFINRGDPIGSFAVIGPDTKPTNDVRHLVMQDEISEMIAKKGNLYSFGVVEYRDIFGNDHWTTFCYRTVSITELNLVACKTGNDVDKN
jgi:hypothetical protein